MRTTSHLLALAGAALLATGCTGTATCEEPSTECGDLCVNLERDPRHCGGCFDTCSDGFVCVLGECECPEGQDCSADACGGACATGQLCIDGGCYVADVLAACFQAGTVVPILGDSRILTGPDFSGIEGPQALARLDDDHLIAVGTLDSVLYVIDRRSMVEAGSLELLPTGGACPNHIVVRDTTAYVVNSCVNTVELVDLSDPSTPVIAGEVSTGAGTNPYAAAIDAQGRLWVSLWLTDQVVPVTFQGAQGTLGTPVPITLGAGEGKPSPSGVAAIGDAVYVALNNLDEQYRPAGTGGKVAVIREGEQRELIDLGPTCGNPGFTGVQGTLLWVACAGAFDADDGEVVAVDTTTGQVTRRVDALNGPARLSVDPDGVHVWVADSGDLKVARIDAAGAVESVDACPAGMLEFAADVLAY